MGISHSIQSNAFPFELRGFDGNYTLEENIRQFFHVWVEGTKRIAPCQQYELILVVRLLTSLSGWYVWGYWQTSSRRRSGKGPTLLFVATKIFTKFSFLSLSIQTNHALWHEEAAEYLSFSAISCSFLYPLNGYIWGGRVTLQTLRENTWSWMDRNSVGVFLCIRN